MPLKIFAPCVREKAYLLLNSGSIGRLFRKSTL